MIAFTIRGKPVGVNATYRTGGGHKGMFKSKEAKQYLSSIVGAGLWAMRGQEPYEGPVSVQITFYFENEQPDIDGPIKPLLDALQCPRTVVSRKGKKKTKLGAGIYRNDRQIRELVIHREVDKHNPRTEVWIGLFVKTRMVTISEALATEVLVPPADIPLPGRRKALPGLPLLDRAAETPGEKVIKALREASVRQRKDLLSIVSPKRRAKVLRPRLVPSVRRFS